jgi:transcriptional regulator with XRE-family HTH domain
MRLTSDTFRFLRRMMGLSMREFAQQVHYSPAYIAMIETGQRPLSDEARKRFTAFYIKLIHQMEEKGEMIS